MARYCVLFTDDGAGKTGLSPTCNVHYADDTTVTNPTVTELDSVNQPGVYYIDFTPTKHVTAVWDAGQDLIGMTRLFLKEYGPEVPERDEGVLPAIRDADPTSFTDPTNLGGWLRALSESGFMPSDTDDRAWYDTTTAATSKFYATSDQPAVSLNARFAQRPAILVNASQGGFPVRITAIANDGSDYFAIETLGGSVIGVSSGDRLIVLGHNLGTDAEYKVETSATLANLVADQVWDEPRSGHVTAGTFGEGVTLYDLFVGSADDDIALAVWGATRATYNGAGDFGEVLQENAEDYVWDALRSAHTGGTSFGEYVNVNNGGIATSIWTDTGYLGASPGSQSTPGSALFALLMTRVEGDSNFFAYYTTVEAATDKFYPENASVEIARSAELVDRLAYYIDATSTPAYQRLPCRVTGVANDVTGDHFTLERLDGSSLSTVSGGFLFVTLQKAPEFEVWRAQVSDHATQAGSLARALIVSGAKLNVVMENTTTTTVNGLEVPDTTDLVFYTDNTKAVEVARVSVSATYSASGTMTGFEALD